MTDQTTDDELEHVQHFRDWQEITTAAGITPHGNDLHMMDLTAHVNIDVLYEFSVHAVSPGSHTVNDMPICQGTWVSLPDPIPDGSYGIVYRAEVTADAPRDARIRVMAGDKLFAVVTWGEKRIWTCVDRCR